MKKPDLTLFELFDVYCILTHTEDTSDNYIKFARDTSKYEKFYKSLLTYKRRFLKEESK